VVSGTRISASWKALRFFVVVLLETQLHNLLLLRAHPVVQQTYDFHVMERACSMVALLFLSFQMICITIDGHPRCIFVNSSFVLVISNDMPHR